MTEFMKIEYLIREEELLETQLLIQSKKIYNCRWMYSISTTLMFVVFIFYLHPNDIRWIPLITIGIFAGIFSFCLIPCIYQRYYKNQIKIHFTNMIDEIVEVHLIDDSIKTIDKTGEMKVKLTTIKKVYETENLFVVQSESGFYLSIAKQDIDSLKFRDCLMFQGLNVETIKEKKKNCFNMKLTLCVIATIYLCLLSCNKVNTLIHQNRTFEDICSIANNNRPFCMVLSDSTQSLSKEYLMHLQNNYKNLTQKAIYNIIDINFTENEWYIKWICPVSIPLTCIFSTDGTLLDLIPGAARETFLYTDLALEKNVTTDYHWPNRFNMDKKRVLPLLNKILKQKLYLAHNASSSLEIESLIDSLDYPYPYYLKMMNELIQHDTTTAKHTAKLLIEIETPHYLDLYKEEFITAKKILTPNFDIDDEPNIRVDNKQIYLSDCITGKNSSFEVIIYNDGNKPMQVSNILTSCSCVELAENNREFIVNAKNFNVIKFNFMPDNEGDISRDICILSNAINMPILNILVQANVSKQKHE